MSSSAYASGVFIHNHTFAQDRIDKRAANSAPIAECLGAVDNNVDRHTKGAEGTAEANHLCPAVLHRMLNDEKVNVAVQPAVAAGVGTEQNHLFGVRLLN